MRQIAFALTFAIAISSLVSAQPRPKLRFTVEELGVEGLFPRAMNDRGQIVAVDALYGGGIASIWTRGTGWEPLPIAGAVSPTDINDREQVVGSTTLCSEDYSVCETRGFVWSAAEGLRDLGTFIPSEINNRGDMAGKCGAEEFSTRPCVSIDGIVQFVGTDLTGEATGINSRGDVVGWVYVGYNAPTIQTHAFHLSRHGRLAFLLPDPLNPTQGETMASDINDAGTIVGARDLWDGMPRHATVWKRGVAIALRTPEDVGPYAGASTINNRGMVLGGAYSGDDPYAPSLVWDSKTGEVARVPDRPNIGVEVYTADLNNRGQIAGAIVDYNQERYPAVIWRVRSGGGQ